MKKALFLDRDGVINVDHGYVSQPEQIDFVQGIFALCQRFKQQGFEIIVVTNQSGIGRGYYTEREFLQLMQWMRTQFAQQGCAIDAVYFCPHHPTRATGQYLQTCTCRKPAPGMFLQAQQEHQLDMTNSLMIGDKASDMQAANQAGVGRRILLSGGDVSGEHTEQYSSLDSIEA
ncbi:D-glycero-beta-D-manno-heptose 1,7-bisphosphate 7-phosphatase [Aestuariibacter salexigens]|uniref:D-glycero-beta-D-manno-heptose 1,7-bisphosphate 7-phosphatase n=1 Tax=Aestuariibacter salexigens TaxID=226010 RepID=UPI00054DC3AE|nr:D-glycero-beta-D-manno-heptose 1,7-bisphosphate 7-phosphatase [Aestuariibacter salexigens]